MYPSASEGADAAPGGEGVLSLFAELLASCLKDGRAAAGECLREDTPAMATQEGTPAATALQQAVGLGSERTFSGHVATRRHASVRDTQTSFLVSKSEKCHADGFPALESCRSDTPAKFWAQLGPIRSSYLGKGLCAQSVTAPEPCEQLRGGLGFLGDGILR